MKEFDLLKLLLEKGVAYWDGKDWDATNNEDTKIGVSYMTCDNYVVHCKGLNLLKNCGSVNGMLEVLSGIMF